MLWTDRVELCLLGATDATDVTLVFELCPCNLLGGGALSSDWSICVTGDGLRR